MLAESAAIYLITAGLMFVAVLGFIWAGLKDQLRAGPDQALVIFDDDDLRFDREWETAMQKAQRQAAYGDPITPQPGQWGGAP